MSDQERDDDGRWTTGKDGVRPIGPVKKTIDYTKPSEQLRRAENAKAIEEARKTK